MEHDYIKDLNQLLEIKQLEMEMGNTEFMEYLGLARSWRNNMRNPNIPDYPLSRKTMSKLYNRLNIDLDLMTNYNKQVKENRKNGKTRTAGG